VRISSPPKYSSAASRDASRDGRGIYAALWVRELQSGFGASAGGAVAVAVWEYECV